MLFICKMQLAFTRSWDRVANSVTSIFGSLWFESSGAIYILISNMGSWTFLHHLQQLMCPWQHHTSVHNIQVTQQQCYPSCNYVAQWSDPQVIHIPVMVRMNQSLVQVQYHDLSTHRNYRITSIFWCQTSVAIHRIHMHHTSGQDARKDRRT